MNDSLAITLAALAQKLGVHVEVLHEALLRQAPVSATLLILALALLVGISAAFTWSARQLTKKSKDYGDDVFLFCAWMLASIVSLGTAIAIAANAEMIYAGLFNPEFWILKTLLPSR